MFKTSKYEVRSEYLELRKTLSMSMREVYSSSKEGKEILGKKDEQRPHQKPK